MEKIEEFKNFIRNKKICLIGSGASIDEYKIDYSLYDVIVGINRLYQTNLLNKINILYHNASPYDVLDPTNEKVKELANQLNYIVFIPGLSYTYRKFKKFNDFMNLQHKNKIIVDLNLSNTYKKKFRYKLLTGISTLIHLVSMDPNKIDIFGYDFYSKEYYDGLKDKPGKLKNHNIEANKKIFFDIINDKKYIKHYN